MNKTELRNFFLENPDVNPETGRRIQRDGPTYKRLERKLKLKQEGGGDSSKVLYFIEGLGCSEFEEELEEFQEEVEQKTKSNVIISCDLRTKHVLKDIIKVSCFMKPKRNQYINSIISEIRKLIMEEKKSVMVCGHSYGGMVASFVAEIFSADEDIDKSKLHFVTSGSIYIPDPKKVKNVAITHYMHVGELVLTCIKKKAPKVRVGELKVDKHNNNLIWINNIGKKNPAFHIHNYGYETIMDYIINYHGEILDNQNLYSNSKVNNSISKLDLKRLSKLPISSNSYSPLFIPNKSVDKTKKSSLRRTSPSKSTSRTSPNKSLSSRTSPSDSFYSAVSTFRR